MRKLPTGNGRYLEHRAEVLVRFNEVDAMRVAWHGHYIAWFEVARESFGRGMGLSYEEIADAGVAAPVVHLECQYLHPARMGDTLEVRIRLHERRAAKLEFSYEITRKGEEVVLARGRTVQVFTDLEGTLCLNRPALLEAFLERHADTWSP